MWFQLELLIWLGLLVQGMVMEPLNLVLNSDHKSKENRIVGGKEAIPYSLPWTAKLVRKTGYKWGCGGTILAPKFVLTAAHCSKTTSNTEVWVGSHNLLSETEKYRSKHQISSIVDHPSYNRATVDFDYSILELANPIEMRDSAMALYLPTPEDDIRLNIKSVFVVSGWGNTEDDPATESPDKLMQVSVPWVSDEDCKSAYKKEDIDITSRMVCAGDLENGGIDSCQQDSGGPMAWLDPESDEVKIIGVVSFGVGCALPGLPGIYAEVSAVLDWVKENIGDANDRTCEQGHCMTKSMLMSQVQSDFENVTPKGWFSSYLSPVVPRSN